jgi:enediyne biosynthesis protein E5
MSPAPALPGAGPSCGPQLCWAGLLIRAALTALLMVTYYLVRGSLPTLVAGSLEPTTVRVVAVSLLLASLLAVWWKVIYSDPRFHAPILITVILALSDASLGILENHPAPLWLVSLSGGWVLEYSPTFVTMAVTLFTEVLVGRFIWGKWPHLASAYISGISVGILMKSSALWPFLMCGVISILSKYVLRIGNRHLFNPTNFGMTVMLVLAYHHAASFSVQAGNDGWAVAVIWILGGLIMHKLGRFHIPLAFIAAFIPLAFLRSAVTGDPWQTELAPITSPMFQLYIFFMITDPKTTVRGRRNQMIVAVLVAIAETVCRLGFKDVHSLYHALFIVGPTANLIEFYADRIRARAVANREALPTVPEAGLPLPGPNAGRTLPQS